MALIMKAAAAELDWPITYDLLPGETITGSSWTVEPSGALAVKAGSPAIASPVVSCILTGGVNRRVYRVRNVAVTSQGRTYEQTIAFRIGDVEAGA